MKKDKDRNIKKDKNYPLEHSEKASLRKRHGSRNLHEMSNSHTCLKKEPSSQGTSLFKGRKGLETGVLEQSVREMMGGQQGVPKRARAQGAIGYGK